MTCVANTLGSSASLSIADPASDLGVVLCQIIIYAGCFRSNVNCFIF